MLNKDFFSKYKSLLLFAIIIIVNVFGNSRFQLHFDEAYYWNWSNNLSLSYYDHPPMIAYLIYLAGFLGHNSFVVRLPALITTSVTCFLIYSLALKMFNRRVAGIALILALSSPLIEGVYFIVSPDCVVFMFFIATIYAFYIGVFERRYCYIYLAGVLAGFGLMSKYTAILLFPSLFGFLLTSPQYRYILRRHEVYIAFLLALLVFSPVIYWNYTHSWVSFTYQFHHGVEKFSGIDLASLLDYLGGQILVSGIFMFLALIYYLVRYFPYNYRDGRLLFLLWPFGLGFCLFAYFSLSKHMEANWAGFSYLTAFVFVAYYLDRMQIKWVYRASVGLLIIILLLTKLPETFLPVALYDKIPNLTVFYGNQEILNDLQKQYLTPDTTIFACDYGDASRATFYLHKRVYLLDDQLFANAFRYWHDNTNPDLHNVLFICSNLDNGAIAIAEKHFRTWQALAPLKFNNVVGVTHLFVYRGTN